MKYHSRLVQGKFIRRESRFSALVMLEGKPVYVHVPNSGRLSEILTPGREVYLLPAGGRTRNENRKTEFSMALARYGTGYVSINSALANDLFEEAFRRGAMSEFDRYEIIGREKRIGMSRIDFLLQNPEGVPTYLEIKSVSLVAEGRGLFPDAPTSRGVKHVKELMEAVEKGCRGAVVFVVQRQDVNCFSPNHDEDPEFGQILKSAFHGGIAVSAYKCHLDPEEIYITDPIPVIL